MHDDRVKHLSNSNAGTIIIYLEVNSEIIIPHFLLQQLGFVTMKIEMVLAKH